MNQVKSYIHWGDAYTRGITGRGVGVAVLDTGIYPHKDFDNRIIAFQDIVGRRSFPYDDNGHGTHISAIIGGSGAASDGKFQGMAPESHIISVKGVLYTVTFIIASGYNLKKSEENVELFFKGVAITVCLISLHTCITGGVEFYELNEYSTEFLRKGILGVGIGDSNYSTLLLNIGIACTLFDRNFKWYMKVGITLLNLFAMTVTLSTSGLIGFLLTLMGFVIVKRSSIPSKVWKSILLLLGMVLLFDLYINLPSTMQNETINAYIDRMQDKLFLVQSGDISSFTTNRSSIADQKMDYFMNGQGVLKQLFGFNSLFADGSNVVPHNTYIDLLLQIGLVGMILTLGHIVTSSIRAWKDKNRNRRDLLLKLLMLYYFLNLSLYHGSLFSLAYLVLIIL